MYSFGPAKRMAVEIEDWTHRVWPLPTVFVLYTVYHAIETVSTAAGISYYPSRLYCLAHVRKYCHSRTANDPGPSSIAAASTPNALQTPPGTAEPALSEHRPSGPPPHPALTAHKPRYHSQQAHTTIDSRELGIPSALPSRKC